MTTRGRRVRSSANALVYTAVVLAILVFANLIGTRAFTRVDLTEGRVYTLSESSKRVVAGLPDRLTVKAFISKDLPPRVAQVGRYIRDLLAEYATYAKGKIQWEVLDPADGPVEMQEANRLKVQPINLQAFEKSKVTVSKSYLGIGFAYGDKIEAIPVAAEVEGLEYAITSLIRKMAVADKKKIGFSKGHGEPSRFQGLQAVSEALDQYDVTDVDLKNGETPVPDDVDVLIVAGPREPLSDRAQYEIDRFLMSGKAVAFLIDGMVLETPRGQMPPGQMPPQIARANEDRLGDMLAHYGVELGRDLIFDPQNALVPLPVAPGRAVLTNYPGFPVVTDLADIPVFKRLRGFVPVFPSAVKVKDEVRKGGEIEVVELARTTAEAWRHQEIFLFDPLRQPTPGEDRGTFVLGVSLHGRIPSFFHGKPLPAPGPAPGAVPGEPGADQPEQAPVSEEPADLPDKSAASARLVVIGDAEFPRDQYLRAFRSNGIFLLNLIDWLAEDEGLIALRAKTAQERPLAHVGDDKVTLYKYANVAGVPLAFMIFGIARWRVRRRRRARLAG